MAQCTWPVPLSLRGPLRCIDAKMLSSSQRCNAYTFAYQDYLCFNHFHHLPHMNVIYDLIFFVWIIVERQVLPHATPLNVVDTQIKWTTPWSFVFIQIGSLARATFLRSSNSIFSILVIPSSCPLKTDPSTAFNCSEWRW